MVSTPTSTVCGSHLHHYLMPRPTVITGVHLGWQVIPSACLEAFVQHCQAACFSKKVFWPPAPPRRPLTNCMCNDRWLCFSHWAAGQGFVLLSPTAAQIAIFLYSVFETRGLSPQTIKGYRSCLASVLGRTGKAAAVQVKTISDLITSVELQGPRITPVLP